jgi:hypothetical protein
MVRALPSGWFHIDEAFRLKSPFGEPCERIVDAVLAFDPSQDALLHSEDLELP